MRSATRLSALGLALGLVLLAAAPAHAAAPSNDTFDTATAVGAVPFTTTADTTGATTDANDAAANADCGAPATDASVWYSVTPATSNALLVDVSRSSYSAGAIVVTGAPGSFTLVACGPGAVSFPANAGTTYHIIVIDDQFDGGGNGGTLNLSVDAAPPPPSVDVTVNAAAGFDPKTGAATLSGTITCTGTVAFTYVQGELTQRVGRGIVRGFFGTEVACDGVARPWSAEVFPEPGTKFAGGKGASVTFAVSCGPVFCGFDYEERKVQLSRR